MSIFFKANGKNEDAQQSLLLAGALNLVPNDGVVIENSYAAPEYEPSPIQGMDMLTFKMNIARALADPDDPAILPAFRMWANEKMSAEGKAKEKSDRAFRDFLLRWQMEDNLRKLQEIADWHTKKADEHHKNSNKALVEINAIELKLHENSEFMDFAHGVISRAGKKGNLNSNDRQEAIRRLREQGIKIDASCDDATIIKELNNQFRKREEENRLLTERYDHQHARYLYELQQEQLHRDAAQEITDKVNDIRNSDMSHEEMDKEIELVVSSASNDELYKASIQNQGQIIEADSQIVSRASEENKTEGYRSAYSKIAKTFNDKVNEVPKIENLIKEAQTNNPVQDFSKIQL